VNARFDGVVDPLRIARTLHDVSSTAMHDLAIRQSKVLLDTMSKSPLSDKAEVVKTSGGDLEVVNMVHGCYSRPLDDDERSLDVDEESIVGTGKRYRSDDATHLTDPSIHNHEESLPPRLSLYGLQRRWIMLGYEKIRGGTCLILRYSSKWPSNHLVFATGRVVSMGANNRRSDRTLMKHATIPFMYHPVNGLNLKPRRAGLHKRVSQNFITVQRLPEGQSICLGLVRAKLKPDETDVPMCFKNIVIRILNKQLRTLLYHNNVINVGTSSLAKLAVASESEAYRWKSCLNTPENVAAEKALIKNGTISSEMASVVLGYTIMPDGQVVPSKSLSSK
jgi:hypothetical protein